jgi:uracil-DNA glycosylase family 4
MDTLLTLAGREQACTSCNLCTVRTQAVPGKGPSNADIVIIGEAPGDQEDSVGEPFYGRSGTLLTKILAEAGISRGDIYVTNMLKCWPGPGNPDPTPVQLAACSGWLDSELEIIQPKGIITLGRFSSAKFLPWDSNTTMGRMQGKIRLAHWEVDKPVYIMPLYHPAALLRNREEIPQVTEYLKKFKELLDV